MTLTPEAWEEMKAAAANSNAVGAQKAQESKCECGAAWKSRWTMQGIGYSSELGCMCDFLTFVCENHNPLDKSSCQKTLEARIPLTGKRYQEMAEEYRREEANPVLNNTTAEQYHQLRSMDWCYSFEADNFHHSNHGRIRYHEGHWQWCPKISMLGKSGEVKRAVEAATRDFPDFDALLAHLQGLDKV